MDAYMAELESEIDNLLNERLELLADIESLQRENEALRELIDDIKKDTAGTMSE